MVYDDLLEKFESNSAHVGIIGLGYVGLPLVQAFCAQGYRVTGFDIDIEKISLLRSGSSYIGHIPSEDVRSLLERGFHPTTDFAESAGCDALIICVPTPLGRYRNPDLSYIVDTLESLLPFVRAGQLISLESTTYPGTTDEEVVSRVDGTGLVVGEDVFVVYSPEREDPGNQKYETQTIPKVIAGATSKCLSLGIALYRGPVERLVPVSSLRAAEMTKLLENIHRAVNIGLVNELKTVTDAMGIDIYEVIDAAATKPFGFTAYYPGPGLGGHCIPIDPFYLTWKALEFGISTRFIELAGEVNRGMPDWVVSKISDALNREKKAVKGARILVLGIAYKKNVDDMRESPAVEIMERLRQLGARVEYSDPHIPRFPQMRNHAFDLRSCDLDPETIASFDVVLLATDHDQVDYEMVRTSARLIVDTRGVFRGAFENVVRA